MSAAWLNSATVLLKKVNTNKQKPRAQALGFLPKLSLSVVGNPHEHKGSYAMTTEINDVETEEELAMEEEFTEELEHTYAQRFVTEVVQDVLDLQNIPCPESMTEDEHRRDQLESLGFSFLTKLDSIQYGLPPYALAVRADEDEGREDTILVDEELHDLYYPTLNHLRDKYRKNLN